MRTIKISFRNFSEQRMQIFCYMTKKNVTSENAKKKGNISLHIRVYTNATVYFTKLFTIYHPQPQVFICCVPKCRVYTENMPCTYTVYIRAAQMKICCASFPFRPHPLLLTYIREPSLTA